MNVYVFNRKKKKKKKKIAYANEDAISTVCLGVMPIFKHENDFYHE